MNKKSIIIIAVCAALIIGGAVVAVPFAKKALGTPAEETVAPISDTESYYDDSYYYTDPQTEYMPGEPVAEPSSEAQAESTTLLGAAAQIAQTAMDVITNQNADSSKPGPATTGNQAAGQGTTARTSTTKAASKSTTKAASKSTTKASTTKKATTKPSTTRDPNAAPISYIAQDAIGEDAASSFLGYRYSSDGYYYCDDKDCWQKGVGYNEVYDKWAPVMAMYIDQIRIRFQYGGKNWMVQLWKGQYGYLLVGAEIGLYTCDLEDYHGGVGDINHFNCADKPDWLYMQLDCYYCKGGNGQYNKIFTRPYDKYWWATGFIKGQLTKYTAPRTELKTKNRITFKSSDMANLFVQGLVNSGFRRAAASNQLVDDSYYLNGADVWVLWSTLTHDCFVGYESYLQETTTAAPLS